jgi:hypothetical protein
MKGKGSYSELEITLNRKDIGQNKYSYYVGDKTAYDPINQEILVNKTRNGYKQHDGLVKNRHSTNYSDGFTFQFESNAYLNREFNIEIPFKNNETFKVESISEVDKE